MKQLVAATAVSDDNDDKIVKLPDPLTDEEPLRMIEIIKPDGSKEKLRLWNPEWLISMKDSTLNQDFINEVVKQTINNHQVSSSTSDRAIILTEMCRPLRIVLCQRIF